MLCSLSGCETPPPVDNSSPIPPATNVIGSTMRYACAVGYEPTATAEVYCMENGEWSVPNFHCVVGMMNIKIHS